MIDREDIKNDITTLLFSTTCYIPNVVFYPQLNEDYLDVYDVHDMCNTKHIILKTEDDVMKFNEYLKETRDTQLDVADMFLLLSIVKRLRGE